MARDPFEGRSNFADALLLDPERTSMLVVDEGDLYGHLLGKALSSFGWTTKACSDPSPAALCSLSTERRAELVLMRIPRNSAGRGALECIEALVAKRIVVVVITDERGRLPLAEMLHAGAAGWVTESTDIDELDRLLVAALAGEQLVGKNDRMALLAELWAERARVQRERSRFDQLSDREQVVLASLVDGLGAKEMAIEHHVSLATIRSQIRAVLTKLGVNSQLAAVAAAHRHQPPLAGAVAANRDAAEPRLLASVGS